ncbi:MAG: hypothetical protein K6E78_09645 [Treponema sp.]|nr:hypothetical protein [Treponema sp.]
MPHSSGGGSHSGGSHSGSHSGSRSGSGSGQSRISKNTYFPGAIRYVYYQNGQPVYFFTNFAVKPDFKDIKYIAKTFFRCLFAIFICFISFSTIKRKAYKLNMNYDTQIQILDEMNVVSDRESLYDSLLRFQDETGITPAILTITDKEWKESYSSLEKYAYDWYVDHFSDEMHWLIVYAADTDLSDDFDDWAWEGMQGDSTDSILKRRERDVFNSELQKSLLQRDKYDVGQAITFAFDELTPIVMDTYIEKDAVLSFVVTSIFAIIFIIAQFGVHPLNKKYRMAKKCPAGYTNQEKCEYCNGLYLAGLHKKCPQCGAPIPLQNQPGTYQPDIQSDPVFKDKEASGKNKASYTYGKNGPTSEDVASKIKNYEEILKASDKDEEDIYYHGL